MNMAPPLVSSDSSTNASELSPLVTKESLVSDVNITYGSEISDGGRSEGHCHDARHHGK